MRATVQCRKSPALKIRSGPEGATAATAIAGTANASDVAARYDETWGNSDIAFSWLSAKEGASQYGDGCIRKLHRRSAALVWKSRSALPGLGRGVYNNLFWQNATFPMG